MLHYRIYGFLGAELLAGNSFESDVFNLRAAMKTQCFANISKAAWSPFVSL